MAKVFGLDVPEELIDLYNTVVKLFPYGENFTTAKIKAIISRVNREKLNNASLFIRWKPVWAEFLTARRTAWANYWQTLPFGSHTGVGGWPGSGYSAFVYVNAPRFRAGLELLLDPPGFDGGIILNGDFSSYLDHWYYDTDLYGSFPYVNVTDGVCTFPANTWDSYGDPPYLAQDLAVPSGSYRLECDLNIPVGYSGFPTFLNFKLYGSDDHRISNTGGEWEHKIIDFNVEDEEEGWPFEGGLRIIPEGMPADIEDYGVGSPILLDNVSVKSL